jgi:hypothetical protein
MAKLLFMIKIAKIIMPKGQISSVSHKKTTSTCIEVVFEYNKSTTKNSIAKWTIIK